MVRLLVGGHLKKGVDRVCPDRVAESATRWIGRQQINLGKCRCSPHSAMLMLMSAVCMWFASTSPVYAMGIGAAEADSYIGQPLVVRIPLFNIKNPQALSVELQSDRSAAQGQSPLRPTIDSSNSQLTIVVTSESVVTEPYINFTLNIRDSHDIVSKDFAVLLNLAPKALQESPVSVRGGISNQTLTARNVDLTNSGSLMGPYDWAEAGNIPARFGAVLDGQSLWRVARRIDTAMGVSRNQMMWALYQANPHAFASESVESLKAGSYLTIPEYSQVAALSDSEAKRRLDQLSGLTITSVARQQPEPSLLDTQPEQSITESATEEVEAPAFQLTSVDQLPVGSSTSGSGDDPRSQEIIGALADTVNNMSEELLNKDKRIRYLEGQVEELQALIRAGEVPISAEPAAQQLIAAPEAVSGPVAVDSETVTTKSASSWWQWLALALFATVALIWALKSRLAGLLQSLNLFGSNDSVAFEELEEKLDKAVSMSDYKSLIPPKPVKEEANYAELSALEKSQDAMPGMEGISFMELDESESYDEEDTIELVSVDEDDTDLSFDERFERLLEEQDYEFARELLDFARYNEINDDRYHCERLRLLKAMHDEDGFYEYYYEIEAKIPKFPAKLQTAISQLVVQLAQN